jgi:AraC-like DNA-binding protein
MYKYQLFDSEQIRLWEADSDDEAFEGRNAHCHRECEIYYLIDGEVEIIVEGQKFLLASDSFLVIPANAFHQWKHSSGKVYHRMSLHFLPEFMNKTEQKIFADTFTEPLHFLNGSRYDLNFYCHAIGQCSKMDNPLQKIAVKHRVMSFLSQLKLLRTQYVAKPVILDECIQRMIVYIHDHLSEPISLDEIAREFAFSKNYLNSRFNNVVGTTIMKYIALKRLEFARKKILDGVRIGEAAYMAGFDDYTTFFRSYKSYFGSSPSDMRILPHN